MGEAVGDARVEAVGDARVEVGGITLRPPPTLGEARPWARGEASST